jgi:pimeloyl-ACP methyl ester carboxylesterase
LSPAACAAGTRGRTLKTKSCGTHCNHEGCGNQVRFHVFLSLLKIAAETSSFWKRKCNSKNVNPVYAPISVSIPIGDQAIHGDLTFSPQSKATVVFAHGSGSSRNSPRNKYVAEVLSQAGLATLLIDLLTPAEEMVDQRTGRYRFDIHLLATRLVAATDWVLHQWTLSTHPVGYFGASTGAAAALVAASERPGIVRAVVSRGGRPDLVRATLAKVDAPTLLIVGELDREVLQLNRHAAKRLRGPSEIFVVPGASHLFEEPGAIERVSSLARDWFASQLLLQRAA